MMHTMEVPEPAASHAACIHTVCGRIQSSKALQVLICVSLPCCLAAILV